MDERAILLIASLLAAPAVLAQAYRWVDEDGIVHYSDRPEKGAEEIELRDANTVSIRRYAAPDRATGTDAEEPAEPFRYESLEIVSPVSEETLWNIEGVLSVRLALTPGLQRGHQLRVYFDGQPQIVTGTSFRLNEVWRGAHNLQAEVIDQTGQVLARSEPRRFYVQQSTVKF